MEWLREKFRIRVVLSYLENVNVWFLDLDDVKEGGIVWGIKERDIMWSRIGEWGVDEVEYEFGGG